MPGALTGRGDTAQPDEEGGGRLALARATEAPPVRTRGEALIPPHAIRERAATDACTTRLRRLKHAATKDKRAGPTRAAACVRRSPLRPCPRSQSFQSPELHGGRVFSAECIPAFDWQSVGLFYSFYHSKQPGRITRLLACEDEQLRVRARRSCAQAEPTLRPSPRPSPRLARPRCTRR